MADEFRRRIKQALYKGTINAKEAHRSKITHQEDRCGLWHGRGQCDCDPQIIVTKLKDDNLPVFMVAPEFKITANGELEALK